jgi:hypothetical protein
MPFECAYAESLFTKATEPDGFNLGQKPPPPLSYPPTGLSISETLGIKARNRPELWVGTKKAFCIKEARNF